MMKSRLILDKIKALPVSRDGFKKVFGGCEEYIRRYRDEACLSQEYMASRLGISQSTYQKIEAGRVNVTEERLGEIAHILGKEIEDFVLSKQKELNENDIEALKEIIALQAKEIKELRFLLNKKT